MIELGAVALIGAARPAPACHLGSEEVAIDRDPGMQLGRQPVIGMDGRDRADRLAQAARLPAVVEALRSKDSEEGVRAFVEKRKPVWRGE